MMIKNVSTPMILMSTPSWLLVAMVEVSGCNRVSEVWGLSVSTLVHTGIQVSSSFWNPSFKQFHFQSHSADSCCGSKTTESICGPFDFWLFETSSIFCNSYLAHTITPLCNIAHNQPPCYRSFHLPLSLSLWSASCTGMILMNKSITT